MSVIKTILAVAVALLALRLWFLHFERKTLYYPIRELEQTPEVFGMAFEELRLQSPGGPLLHGWYIPREGASHAMLFLHGNAGNISHRMVTLDMLHRLGVATLIMDYRGYGRSEGKPSEAGMYQDARAAYEHLRRMGWAADRIVLFGESLGCAIAIDLAADAPVHALILEGAFSSVLEMGQIYFPYLPVRWLLTQKFDSLSKIGKIRVPKYFIHSREDEIVPFALARRLHDAAPEPKAFIERRGGHNDYLMDPGVYESVLQRVRDASQAP